MKHKKKYHKDCAGTAVQIVFEYPDWCSEHIEEMWGIACREDKPLVWDIDDLEDATNDAQQFKEKGLTYKQVLTKLTKGFNLMED